MAPTWEKDFHDIDIGIVSEKFKDKDLWQRAEMIGDVHWDLVNLLGVSLDIIAISPQEWKEGDSILFNYIKKNGKTLT